MINKLETSEVTLKHHNDPDVSKLIIKLTSYSCFKINSDVSKFILVSKLILVSKFIIVFPN